jgi:hypothetical protein
MDHMKFWLTFISGVVIGAIVGGFFTSFFLYDDVTRDNRVPVKKSLVQHTKPKQVAAPQPFSEKIVQNRTFPISSGKEDRRFEKLAVPSVDEEIPPSAVPAQQIDLNDLPPAGVPAEAVSADRWDEASIAK